MNEIFLFNLKQPCKNRNATLVVHADKSVSINGHHFVTMRECEDYLESLPRVDFQLH